MGQIIETLPKGGKETLKSTYENIIDLGMEKGLEKGLSLGTKRGEKLRDLNLIIKAVKDGLEVNFISKFLEVPAKLVKVIRRVVNDNFQTKSLKIIMANEILSEFEALTAEEIAKFCQLPAKEVEVLKTKTQDD